MSPNSETPGAHGNDTDDVIGVIGTGDLGSAVGISLGKLGYQIVYGTRDPSCKRVKQVVKRTGNGASATSQKEAAQRSDIVFLAVPWPEMEQVARNLGDLNGKLVADGSFPYRQATDGYMESMVETSSAELIQNWNPHAIVLKWSLPGSNWIDRPSTEEEGGRIAVWIAGNDRKPKEKLARLTDRMGLEPFDAGPLRLSRELDAQANLYMVPFVQGRKETWDYIVRRTDFFSLQMSESREPWYRPVYDAGNLAQFPNDESIGNT